MDVIDCRVCGCELNHADVRQLALYYHEEQPSHVAVQFVCPRCGTSKWEQYDPEAWGDDPEALASEWSGLDDDVEVLILDAEDDEELDDEEWAAYDLRGSIGVDEYIDFGLRVADLSAVDLLELRASLA